MRRTMPWGLVLLLAIAAPCDAQPNGAWTTLLRAFRYTDLLADGDTVWCATHEAGLLSTVVPSGTFESRVRQPGGLASNHLNVVALDRSRRLWVGTDGAGASVLAADRATWRLVNVFDGLPTDTVTVLEAQGDTVWIGTSRGIALWNGHEISGVLPDGSGSSPFANNAMRGVAVLGDTVWVATANGAYRSLVSGGLVDWPVMNAGLRTGDLGALASAGGELMTLDSLRALRFDRLSSSWVATPSIGNVRYLADDHDRIVAASSGGIYFWNGTAWTRVNAEMPSPGVPRRDLTVTVDAAGRFYAANQNGLYTQPAGTGSWPVAFPSGPPGNDVLNLALDSERLYMTTRDEGFGRLEGGLWRHWPAANSTISDTTTFRSSTYGFALLVDRDRRKWVGCWDNALESFHDDIEPPGFTHWWTPVPVCPNNACDDTIASHTFAWAAALDSSGGHWFGMDSPRAGILGPIGLDYYGEDGAFVANYNQNNTALRDGRIHALTVDPRGRIWVGYAGKGLDHFDWPPDHGGPAPLHVNGVGDANVAGLAATRDGIWVLTAEDLLRVGFDGDVLGSYELPGAVADLALNPIDVAPDGRVWVGTAAGIRVFRTEGMVADYTAANSPLADDQVRTLRIDRATGVVWIGTPSGINRLDPAYVPPAPVLPRLEVDAFPNPARLSALGSGVRLIGNVAELRGEVYDLTGRLLHRFRAAAGQVVWNGTGPDGRVVKPGIYFIRAEANGRSGTVRVALVR